MSTVTTEAPKSMRTRVACINCKKRKSKCDGEHPCSNCTQRQKECIFPANKEVRRRGKGLSSSKAEISQISQRLEALESVLVKLSEKLSSSKISQATAKSDSSSGSSATDRTILPSPVSSGGEVSRRQSTYKDEMAKKELCCTMSKNVERIHQYFGNHSIFAIFSKDSVSWLRKKLINEPVLVPFKNLPIVLDNMIKSSTSLWVNSPTPQIQGKDPSEGDFPINSDLVFEIIAAYYESLYFALSICEVQTVRDLFQTYYAHNTPTGQFRHRRHRFKYSELILMNCALALALDNRTEMDKTNRAKYPNLSKLTECEIYTLRESFFTTAVSYYQKISVINEGIRTVQCLLLMVFCVECTYASDFHIVYMLASVLVRYAQELGLHRIETLNDMSPEDVALGRRLWMECEYIDTEICYKSGKPPLINAVDVSTLSHHDNDIRSVPFTLFSNPANAPCKESIEALLKVTDTQGILIYCEYFNFFLNRIRRKSYFDLYTADAQCQSSAEILKRILNLNEIIFKVNDLMDPLFRPFETKNGSNNEKSYHVFAYLYELECPLFLFYVWTTKLTYLSHTLIINASLLRSDLKPSEYESCFKLALNCARSILDLATRVDKNKVSRGLLSWLGFHPLVASITLLSYSVSVPKNPMIDHDCRLLIETSLTFFVYKNPNLKSWDEAIRFESKLTLYDLVSRVFVGLLVSFMKKTANVDYLALIPGLKEHLESCEQMYPELFDKDVKQIDTFKTLFKNSYSYYHRVEPRLENIIEPGPSDKNASAPAEEEDPLPYPFNTWTEHNDDFSALLYSQMYNLPNMFFDAPEELFNVD